MLQHWTDDCSLCNKGKNDVFLEKAQKIDLVASKTEELKMQDWGCSEVELSKCFSVLEIISPKSSEGELGRLRYFKGALSACDGGIAAMVEYA